MDFVNLLLKQSAFFWIANIATILLGAFGWYYLDKKAKITGSIQLRSYVPTLWTSLGILFTFVSIFVSLLGYTKESVELDVIGLIKNIIPAFSTSIIGIIGAISSTIINRVIVADSEKTEDDKFRKISKGLCADPSAIDSPELLLFEIIKAIRENNNDLCKALQANQCASKINAQDIVSAINRESGHIILKVNESISEQQKSFNVCLNKLAEEFTSIVRKLKDDLALEMRDLRGMLKDEIRQIETQNSTLITTLVNNEKELLDLIKCQLVEESEKRNAELKSFIIEEDKRLESYIDTANEAFGALYTRFEACISEHVAKETELFQTEIRSTIETFAETQHQICCDTISECNSLLVANSNAAIRTQTEVNNSFIADLQNTLSNTCKGLTESVKIMSEDLRVHLKQLEEQQASMISTTVQDNLENIKLLMESNRDSIAFIVENMGENNERFRNSMIELQRQIAEDILSIEKSFNASIDSNSKTTLLSLKEIHQSLIGIGNNITESLSALGDTIKGENQDYVRQLDNLKQEVVDRCASLLSQLIEKIDQSSRIDKLKSVSTDMTIILTKCIDDFVGRMGIVINQIETTGKSILQSTERYEAIVGKSDVINRYIEGTTDLFKLHSNAMTMLQASLTQMEKTIKGMSKEVVDATAHIKSEKDKMK